MPTRTLPDSVGRLVAAPELIDLARTLEKTAAVVAAVRARLNRPVLLVCGHIDEADDLADDVELFTAGERPDVLPALELGGSLGRVSEEQVSNRLKLISRLATRGEGDAGVSPVQNVIVAPVQALMQSVPAKDQLQHLVRTLRTGQELEPEKLIVWLADHGYNRLDQVEVPGDFAVRGGIDDVYLPGEFEQSTDEIGLTVRIDFFGDQIE